MNADGSLIERCAGNNCTNFIQIAQTSANVTAFASAGLNPQTFYTFRVRAFGTGGNLLTRTLQKTKHRSRKEKKQQTRTHINRWVTLMSGTEAA